MSGVTPLYAGGSSKFGASSRAFGQLPRNSGFLEKLSSGGMLSSPKWQRRYFALGDGVLAWAKTATKITNCGEACLKLDGARVEYSQEDGSCVLVLEPAEDISGASAKIRARYELRALNVAEALRWYDQLDRTVQQLVLRSARINESARGNVYVQGSDAVIEKNDSSTAVASSNEHRAAGRLLLKAQGSQNWRVVFGYAFGGALRLYEEEVDCPHDISGAEISVHDNSAEAETSGEGNSPPEAETPRRTMARAQTADLPLAVIDIVDLGSAEDIQLSMPQEDVAHTDDSTHIMIQSGGRVVRLRAIKSHAATAVWHTKLRELWQDAADNASGLQRLPNSGLVNAFDLADAGDPVVGRTRVTVEDDRDRIVEEQFEHKIGAEVGSEGPWRDAQYISTHVQPVLEQAEHLMDAMAMGLVEAGAREDVANWWMTAFYSRFMDMLRGFGARTPPVSGDTKAYDPNDAIAIIHWCKQFRERCGAMGIDPDVFETDPTEHGVYQALANAHMPSYRGDLHKKNASLGWSKRYYALHDGSLKYFTSELMEREHGCIPCELITPAQIDTDDDSGRTFSFTWAGKHTQLYAHSSDEANIWVERINKARLAAIEMENVAAARTCFEVEAFDGHVEVGVSKVRRDCDAQFDAVLRELSGSGEAVQPTQLTKAADLMRLTEAADLLVDQLQVRVQRIPDDRPDVRNFFVEQFHTNISERILTHVASKLSEWAARDVCHFLFWMQQYDKEMSTLRNKPMENPLARVPAWNDAVPGFASHDLPSYTGWVQQQYASDSSWNGVWLIIQDSVARWYSDDHDQATKRTLGTMALTDDAEVNHYTEDGEQYQLTVRTKQETLKLQVPQKDARPLLLCLKQSVCPVLPGESVRLSADGDDGEDLLVSTIREQEQANARLTEFREHKPEELRDMIRQTFSEWTQEMAAELRNQKPAQAFRLEHVLQLFDKVLDELIAIVDDVLLATASGDGNELPCVNFHILTRHQLLEECTETLCDPNEPFMDSGCNVVVDKDNVVELLKWVADYTSRLNSVGVTIEWGEDDTDSQSQPIATDKLVAVKPLQWKCYDPMSAFVEAQRITFQSWLQNATRIEQPKEQDGHAATSLPLDLFRMISETTQMAAASASQWLLVNTVTGVIVPQVRVWACELEDKLLNSDEPPKYFCQCMNNMYESQQLYIQWTDDLDSRVHTPEMVSNDEADELQTDAVPAAFRAILNVATERLCEGLLKSDDMTKFLEALTFSGRHHAESTGISNWAGEQMIRPMLASLRNSCRDLEAWLTPRMYKRAMDQLLSTTIRTYERQLLTIARAPKVTSWGRQGRRREPSEVEAFVSVDIEHMHEFFVELGLKEPTIRTAQQTTMAISKLMGCSLEDFEAEVQKAAFLPEFSADTVQYILEARTDVHRQERLVIVRTARSNIDTIHEAINPSLPRRPAGGPTVVLALPTEQETLVGTQVRYDDGSIATRTPRVVASYPYTAQESEDLSFEPGEPVYSCSSSCARFICCLGNVLQQSCTKDSSVSMASIGTLVLTLASDLGRTTTGDIIVCVEVTKTWWSGYIEQHDGQVLVKPGTDESQIKKEKRLGLFPPNFTNDTNGWRRPDTELRGTLPAVESSGCAACCNGKKRHAAAVRQPA